MSSGVDAYGNWYSSWPAAAATAAQGFWQVIPQACLPITMPATCQPAWTAMAGTSLQVPGMVASGGDATPVTATVAMTSTTAATQATWAIRYISATYGYDWAVAPDGLAWRTRALTLEELMGEG